MNIYIGDSDKISTNPKCGGDHQIDENQPSMVSCQGMRGRYVGVRLPGPDSQSLHLCEVQVFSDDDCLVEPADRQECGLGGITPITPEECHRRGCCLSTVGAIKCFHKKVFENTAITGSKAVSATTEKDSPDATAVAGSPDVITVTDAGDVTPGKGSTDALAVKESADTAVAAGAETLMGGADATTDSSVTQGMMTALADAETEDIKDTAKTDKVAEDMAAAGDTDIPPTPGGETSTDALAGDDDSGASVATIAYSVMASIFLTNVVLSYYNMHA
ncbi:integumentary mucin C.1-like isoform X1 [Branchiostoma lanceolatum]|uniref:integumentary mucin C.1-like isoform X1 n=1 Tax=Branchiostoma lanceolatum TaxID=7740 RepID=UPI003453A03B